MHERNRLLAEVFQAMANLLATQRANPYRVRSYRKAAETIISLEEDVADILKRKELDLIPGVGRHLAGKIQEYLETGTIRSYEELKSPLPEEVSDWASLPGMSESIVGYLYFRLGIRTLTDLDTLVRSHLMRTMPGFTGPEDALLQAIHMRRQRSHS
jgi:DNA polymerase (family X)